MLRCPTQSITFFPLNLVNRVHKTGETRLHQKYLLFPLSTKCVNQLFSINKIQTNFRLHQNNFHEILRVLKAIIIINSYTSQYNINIYNFFNIFILNIIKIIYYQVFFSSDKLNSIFKEQRIIITSVPKYYILYLLVIQQLPMLLLLISHIMYVYMYVCLYICFCT